MKLPSRNKRSDSAPAPDDHHKPSTPKNRVRSGRYTAVSPEEGIVVFLIGMHINHPFRVWQWLPVLASMPPMLRELSMRKDLGMLGFHVWPGRTVLVLQYWKSFEQLTTYSRASERLHVPAWRRFNRLIGSNGDVGIWHETYVVPAENAEAIHVNMPPSFGLLGVLPTVPATGTRRTAQTRLGKRDNGLPVGTDTSD